MTVLFIPQHLIASNNDFFIERAWNIHAVDTSYTITNLIRVRMARLASLAMSTCVVGTLHMEIYCPLARLSYPDIYLYRFG